MSALGTAVNLMRAGRAFAAVDQATLTGSDIDLVLGVGTLLFRLGRIGSDMARQVDEIDREAADEMVELIRERAPRRTGTMAAAPRWTQDQDGMITVEIPKDFAGPKTAYYPQWVEFGTSPHALFKKGEVNHPGAAAQPFFFPAVREVMARRHLRLLAVGAIEGEI